MLSGYISLFLQSLLFVLGVYVQKFARRRFCSKEKSERIRLTTRIITCSIVTVIILLFNFNQICSETSIPFLDCFFLQVEPVQIVHVLVANTLLFSTHIWQQFILGKVDYSRYTVKSVLFAPLLEEMLFRASFYRSGFETVSTVFMAFLFSVSHLHRPIYKSVVGQPPNWSGSIGQMIFTFIFGCYSFYFLNAFQSVVPSIILHCYCNFLGPPRFNGANFKWHCCSVISVIVYCYLFI